MPGIEPLLTSLAVVRIPGTGVLFFATRFAGLGPLLALAER